MINSDKSNDFVDNNNYSYILAIAYIIIYEDKVDIIKDDEFWGLKAVIFIFKYNAKATLVYYVLDKNLILNSSL